METVGSFGVEYISFVRSFSAVSVIFILKDKVTLKSILFENFF